MVVCFVLGGTDVDLFGLGLVILFGVYVVAVMRLLWLLLLLL